MATPLLLLLSLLFLPDTGLALFDCIEGKGAPATRTIPVDSVSGLIVKLPHDLRIHKGKKARVRLQGPADLVQNIIVETSGDELTLDNQKCTSGSDDKTLRVDVTLDRLRLIRIMGAADVDVRAPFKMGAGSLEINGAGDIRGEFDARSLDVDIRGAGDVHLRGKTGDLAIDIKGAGNVDAVRMEAATVEVSIKGTGDVKIHATRAIDANVMGNGNVRYKGRPRVKMSRFGAGSIAPL